MLRRVVAGDFDADPDAVVADLNPRQVAALDWAIQEGLVDDNQIKLTETGDRFYTMIGGTRP